MKIALLSFLTLATTSLKAQHYYKDVIGIQESRELVKTYRNAGVNTVVLTSYDENNVKVSDFIITQRFEAGRLQTKSFAGTSESTLTSTFDGEGRLVKTTDSSALMLSTSAYTYDAQGRITSITTTSADTAKKSVQTEQRLWSYDSKGHPKMVRIRNGSDTSFVSFKADEKGNIIEEQETRRQIPGEPFYYYYDGSNRLSDIVRFNQKAKRLLPEYMFEYSPSNQVIQKITVPSHNDEYLIWRYQYNDKGLKVKEAIYNKQKQLTGKIEYMYSMM